MSTPTTQTGTGVSIEELVEKSGGGPLEEFRDRFGDAFLVHTGKANEMQPPDRPWRATVAPGRRFGDQDAAAFGKTTLVYPIRHSERALSPLFISVGRVAGTNDIVINDESISGAHAVFERSSDGDLVIRDLGSRNGTFVNKETVSRHESRKVRVGDTVRLGVISMMYVDARRLMTLARAMSG